MKKLFKSIGSIPHLFGKLIVSVCVLCGIRFSERALQIHETTGYDTAAVLAVILGFFGGELMVLCLRTIFEKNKNKKVSDSDIEGEYHE